MAAKNKGGSPEPDQSREARGAEAKAAAADPDAGVVMTVDAKALHKALGEVTQVIVNKVKIPILSTVLVEAEKGGTLRLFGTNMDMQAEASMTGDEARIEKGGAFCVEARLLMQIAARMKGEIVLEYNTARRRLKLGTGRGAAELPTLPAIDFPKLEPIAGEVSFNAAAGAMSAGFGTVASSVSTEETRHYLNGVYLEHRGNCLLFTSTDGHRLTHLPVTIDGDPLPDFGGAIVPRQIVQPFIKLCEAAEAPVKVSVSDRMIEIANTRSAIRSKLIDGTFPDYNRVVPKGPFTDIPFPVEDMKEALELVMAACVDRSRSVTFRTEEGRLTLKVINAEGQRAEAHVEHVDIAPGSSDFGLNGTYLLTALDKLKADEGLLRMKDPAAPFHVCCEGDELVQVIMPVRV